MSNWVHRTRHAMLMTSLYGALPRKVRRMNGPKQAAWVKKNRSEEEFKARFHSDEPLDRGRYSQVNYNDFNGRPYQP